MKQVALAVLLIFGLLVINRFMRVKSRNDERVALALEELVKIGGGKCEK